MAGWPGNKDIRLWKAVGVCGGGRREDVEVELALNTCSNEYCMRAWGRGDKDGLLVRLVRAEVQPAAKQAQSQHAEQKAASKEHRACRSGDVAQGSDLAPTAALPRSGGNDVCGSASVVLFHYC